MERYNPPSTSSSFSSSYSSPSSSSSSHTRTAPTPPQTHQQVMKKRRRRDASRRTPDTSSMPQYLYQRIPSLSLTFLFISCLLTILLPVVSAAPPCVRFADYDSINQMFIDGGPGTKVFLCPSKLYRLSGTIVFTAADQELATYGYPTGSERAILRVEGKQTSTVIQGDCRRCARVGVRSLIIDGNRKKLGRIKNMDDAAGLVILGGNEGQSVKNCWIKNPRGFTALHIREGDKLQCTGAMIDKNEIGPVGEEYDPDLDGEDPESSPLGRPLADGLSIACRDSFVRDNTFYDNTDASIVIYCSPGTLVLANHITARSLSSMAGILLVDQTPFDGDYSGVVVKQNIIDAASRSIRVGIGIGSTVWSDDTETILKGGTILNNGLKGRYMGYGIAAAGLEGFKVKGNWDEAQHQGQKSARCFDEPVNPDPMPFLYNLETIKESEFQDGFKDHDFQYVVCIDGLYDKSNPPKHDLPPLPHDLDNEESKKEIIPPPKIDKANTEKKDTATSNDVANEEEEEDRSPDIAEPSKDGFSTGSEVMDDILTHSQQRMLEAIDHLHRRVDILASNVDKSDKDKKKKSGVVGESLDPAISTHLEKLQRRVEHLETSQKNLLESAIAMRSSIQSWDQEMATIGEWQYDILLDVRHKLDLHSSHFDAESGYVPPPGDEAEEAGMINEINSPRVDHTHPSIDRDNIRDLSNKQRLSQTDRKNGWIGNLGWWLKVILLQGIIGIGLWLLRGWWKGRRVHGKIL
ncbi:hypothetical protein L486_04328 [Kwoniella mangroviensis CBS 10435]|uniref:Right handed beta helix domain-containing protein n=2 Tax=Kwoniella mangrovensis TaxID=463800 RepID=A0A1B9IRX3_9TREE|nr:hypothetical protein L486_04328 [Kwoniella mangroviensis CBS 10435]